MHCFETFRRTWAVGAALGVALAVPAVAQDPSGDRSKPEPAAPERTAAPATAQTGADSNAIAVTGLSRENTTAVKAALERIATLVWRCTGCSLTQAEKGTCAACKQDLVSEKNTSLRDIKIDADKGTIGFALAPGQKVRLSEIEAALAAQKITVPREKLTLSQPSTLVVSGVPNQDAIGKLETELRNAKLFDSVSGRLVGADKRAELTVRSGATAPTRAKVEDAIAKAGAGFKLADIVWTSTAAAPPAGGMPEEDQGG